MHIVSGENKQMGMPGYTTFLPGACTYIMVMFSPPHIVSLVSLPSPTLQKTPACSFQFYFSAPFPPLVLSLSINNFYLASTGGIWRVINSLNFKFQVRKEVSRYWRAADCHTTSHVVVALYLHKIICITHTRGGWLVVICHLRCKYLLMAQKYSNFCFYYSLF